MNKQDGRIHSGLAIVLAFAAIAFLLLTSRGCLGMSDMGFHGSGWWGAPWRLMTLSGLLQLVLAVWVGVDAQKRGSNGYFWGLLVFVTSIIGLLVYLLWVTDAMEKISHEVHQARAQPARDPVVVDAVRPGCPSCGGEVEDDFKVCPSCGASLRCPGCDKNTRAGWTVCPWCATKLG